MGKYWEKKCPRNSRSIDICDTIKHTFYLNYYICCFYITLKIEWKIIAIKSIFKTLMLGGINRVD